MTTYTGSCSCGAIKIQFQGDPAVTALCHCLNCQKTTSSTYSTNWVVPKSAFTLVSGEPTVYEATGGSGNPVYRKFCGTCSSTMWTENTTLPDIVVVKAGVLDDGVLTKFAPGSESFTVRKMGWVGKVDGAVQFERGYVAPSK